MKSTLPGITTKLALIVGLGGISPVYGQSVVPSGEVRVLDRMSHIFDRDMIKVSFGQNNAVLDGKSMAALADFVKATKDESKVERYLVAAWSDQETPLKGELTKAQRDLAAKRADHIKKALGASGATNVDTFEMTKQPNWIQKSFSTESAEVSGKGMSITDNDKLLKKIGLRLRSGGGPRTVVVIAKFKNEDIQN